MLILPEGLYYFVGETPPPLPWQYENRAGDLITSISGATITGKFWIDGTAKDDITCTNDDDGTGSIDWDTSTSDFVLAEGQERGIGKLRLKVDEGGGIVWYLGEGSFPIIA